MNLNIALNLSSKLRIVGTCNLTSLLFYCSYPHKFTNPLLHCHKVMKFEYPEARRDETVQDVYHGVKISDPYRWLEDPDSEETKQFVDAQNGLTTPYLHSCKDRDKLNASLTQMWDYPKFSCPSRHGDRYFYFQNTGLQNQSVLYKQESLDGKAEVFLDPNTLSPDGTVALSSRKFSEDGSIMAYTLSRSGSDWVTIHFKNVQTGKDYPDKLERVKFTSLAWTHDGKGIFYGQYPETEGKADGSETNKNQNQKLYYHVLGTPQSDDVLVVEFPEEPEIISDAAVSVCGRWLLITARKLCKDNLLYFADLNLLQDGKINCKIPLTQVVFKLEADYMYVTNDGPEFVFRTNKNAPNYRLIKINFEQPEEANWETLVPEHPHDVLDWARVVATDKLVLCYLRDVKDVLVVCDLKTGDLIKELSLPLGTVMGFSGKRKYTEIFYHFTSFLSPGTIYRVDLGKSVPEPEVFREIQVEGLDLSEVEQHQVFYPSKDGSMIPMFIIHKKGLQKNGENCCLLYGYGGFNVSLQAGFSVTKLAFIKHFNGVYAIANLRGGGEYGEKWHNEGRLFKKQNVFDDFHAAAEFLIAEGYTSTKLLAIQGGSNGGLLVAACLNQRPDLYAAGIAQVGVLDMLRYHKFTIGGMWVSDYGNPDDEMHFKNIIKYSPLHNIKVPDGQYPAILLLTADHDDRVVPLHSLKFIATLQHVMRKNPRQENPLLIRIETKAGHGSGKPTAKLIEEFTDMFCFLVNVLGLKYVD